MYQITINPHSLGFEITYYDRSKLHYRSFYRTGKGSGIPQEELLKSNPIEWLSNLKNGKYQVEEQ